ncbi:MAG: hypothetical protein OEM28_03215 [Nitrosopumilus sp.]|nr:hypothetical protein [Nitrosopumilus sp.]MDH3487450.1 hypothetical protein [Nitrosopumilus sp.]
MIDDYSTKPSDPISSHLKAQNQTQRYYTFGQKMAVSDTAIEKINKIISEDKQTLWSRQNQISN